MHIIINIQNENSFTIHLETANDNWYPSGYHIKITFV